jgi:uncharacterized Zn finger protein
MASRETAAAKAQRYLVEGRVILVRVTESTALAKVRGSGQIWTVTASPAEWSCSCPARFRCSHKLAVGLVTAIGIEEPK